MESLEDVDQAPNTKSYTAPHRPRYENLDSFNPKRTAPASWKVLQTSTTPWTPAPPPPPPPPPPLPDESSHTARTWFGFCGL
jgi:hypothetical protein